MRKLQTRSRLFKIAKPTNQNRKVGPKNKSSPHVKSTSKFIALKGRPLLRRKKTSKLQIMTNQIILKLKRSSKRRKGLESQDSKRTDRTDWTDRTLLKKLKNLRRASRSKENPDVKILRNNQNKAKITKKTKP